MRALSILFRRKKESEKAGSRLTRQEISRKEMIDKPCLALSSENSLATSSNLPPSLSFSRACSFLECFSHYFIVNLMLALYPSRSWIELDSFKNEKRKIFGENKEIYRYIMSTKCGTKAIYKVQRRQKGGIRCLKKTHSENMKETQDADPRAVQKTINRKLARTYIYLA